MPETGSRKSVIGAGATFTGQLIRTSALDIHGSVNADISADRLHLHEGGHLNGNLDIRLGVFAGEYKGRMKAVSVWMMRSARIFGEIEYNALQMDRGSALNCHILHNWTDTPDSADNPTEMVEAGFLTDMLSSDTADTLSAGDRPENDE